MKLHAVESTVEKIGTKEEGQFSIKASGKAFSILSNALYSDKLGAIIRELSCNAYDSHVQANKKHIPIQIHLPSQIEPWFSVKDEGTGLDHEDVMVLYTTYFESTKANSNDFIGAFGLGSKAPFSYTDQFTVISNHNGIKSTYTAFINDDSIPNIVLMHKAQTSDANGLEVKVPVKKADTYQFDDKVKNILKHFNPLPTVNVQNFQWPEIKKPFIKGQDWMYLGGNHDYRGYGIYVIQGNIEYQLEEAFTSFLTNEQKAEIEVFMKNLHIQITCKIGDLEVSASREKLSYTKQTAKTLYQKVVKIKNDLGAEVAKLVNEIPKDSLWKYNIKLNELQRQHYDLFRIYGKHTINNFEIDFAKYPDVSVTSGDLKINKRYRDLYTCTKDKKPKFEISPIGKKVIIIVDAEIPDRWISNYVYLNFVQPDRDTYQVVSIKPGQNKIETILDVLGNPDYILTSTIPKPAVGPKKPRAITKHAFNYLSMTTNSVDPKTSADNEVLPTNGLYLETFRGCILNETGSSMKLSQMNSIFSIMKDLSWLQSTDKIILFQSSKKQKVVNDPSWVNLFTFAKKKIDEFFTTAAGKDILLNRHANSLNLNYYVKNNIFKFYNHSSFSKIANTDFGKFCAEYAKSYNNKTYTKIFDLIEFIQYKVEFIEQTNPFEVVFKNLQEKYVMMNPFLDDYHYSKGTALTFELIFDYILSVDKQNKT